ncbi:hypothetical protein [Robiginitalea biformata]|uniref:hypothetical protein n=1 Tax=Robiginitalea biformata TaxID=252307 RepID=UPI003B5CE202
MKIVKGITGSLFFLLLACGGGGSDDREPEPQPDPPSAATLIFPGNNTECTEGEIISPTQSRITFQWNLSQNTDSYELIVRNLNTNSELSTTTNTNEATLSVNRGTPYQWQVVSRANGVSETAASPTWRFYNEGPGVENYAPFPAQAIAPARGAHLETASEVTLEWSGSDVDGDIEGYEVFLGTGPGALESVGTTGAGETTLTVPVAAATTYYWRVTTSDSVGNSSESELFEFLVQ